MIGGNAFQAANGDRCFVGAASPAGWFTGPVTDTPEYARKNITLPVQHVRIGKPALGDLADVLGDIGMGRTRPLAVDDLVEIIRIIGIGGLCSQCD